MPSLEDLSGFALFGTEYSVLCTRCQRCEYRSCTKFRYIGNSLVLLYICFPQILPDIPGDHPLLTGHWFISSRRPARSPSTEMVCRLRRMEIARQAGDLVSWVVRESDLSCQPQGIDVRRQGMPALNIGQQSGSSDRRLAAWHYQTSFSNMKLMTSRCLVYMLLICCCTGPSPSRHAIWPLILPSMLLDLSAVQRQHRGNELPSPIYAAFRMIPVGIKSNSLIHDTPSPFIIQHPRRYGSIGYSGSFPVHLRLPLSCFWARDAMSDIDWPEYRSAWWLLTHVETHTGVAMYEVHASEIEDWYLTRCFIRALFSGVLVYRYPLLLLFPHCLFLFILFYFIFLFFLSARKVEPSNCLLVTSNLSWFKSILLN